MDYSLNGATSNEKETYRPVALRKKYTVFFATKFPRVTSQSLKESGVRRECRVMKRAG